MPKALLFITLLSSIFISSISLAQSTRSLSGTLTLDVGPSGLDRNIEITVRNHSFLVVPPSFAIVRPITSFQSTRVILSAGSSSVDYSINNIITNPVDYTISIECVRCSNDFPNQFYGPDGNKLGLPSSSYIAPDDLPEVLNLTAITRVSISGEIMLDRVSNRNLRFKATVFNSKDPERLFKILSPITLVSGTSAISYTVSGLNRAIGSDNFGVKLQCINCAGPSRSTQVFPMSLSPNENHSQINFSVTDEPIPRIEPIIILLLN